MIHYLILAHNNLDQLELLVNKLKTKNSRIYIHLDKKIKDFKKLENVNYIKDRQDITRWWTKMLKAELIWLSEISKNMEEWDHVVILSWQCFPIKPIDYIEKKIGDLKEKSCILCFDAKESTLNRICKYNFFDVNFRIPKKINNFFVKILSYFKKFDTDIKLPVINAAIGELVSFVLPRRTYLTNKYTIYWGSSWMALSYPHVKFLVDFIKSDEWKKVLKHFKYTANNDEVFFQTILVNNKKDEIVNKMLWYTIWKDWAASPNYLTIEDLEGIKKSDKLFARKFDINKDKKVLEILNAL